MFINAKQQRASQRLADFADHFTGVSQRLSGFEQQLEAMSPWMADMFSVGQPVFEDEALEPIFLDAMGNLAAHDEVVPAPRLELQSGSLNDLRSILCELAKNAKLEMKRGNKGAVEELLQVFIGSGEKFSTSKF